MAHISHNAAAFESSSLLQSPGPTGRGIPAAVSSYDSVSIKSSVIASTVDDAVSLGVKRLCTTFITCTVLWLISYVVIMLQVIEKGHFVPFTSFLFIPMWIGSLYGLVSIALIIMGVCKHGGTLISKERRLFMLALGLQIEQYIDFESLPLMRRLFFWSTVLATFLLLTLTTQIFLYLWIVAGLIGMWHAVIPLLITFTVIFIYLILVKTMSLTACSCFALSFLGMVSNLHCAKLCQELFKYCKLNGIEVPPTSELRLQC
jgi:hypothetical protein